MESWAVSREVVGLGTTGAKHRAHHLSAMPQDRHWNNRASEGTVLSSTCGAQCSGCALGLTMQMCYPSCPLHPVPPSHIPAPTPPPTRPPGPAQRPYSSCFLMKNSVKGKWDRRRQGLRRSSLSTYFLLDRQGTAAGTSLSEKEATILFSIKPWPH